MAPMNVPNRGPFVLPLKNGTVDVWYDRNSRSWVVQTKDHEGNQTGPNLDGTAVYVATRDEAVREVLTLT